MSRRPDLDPESIDAVVRRVRARFGGSSPESAKSPPVAGPPVPPSGSSRELLGEGVFASVDEAVTAARSAFEAYQDLGFDLRHRLVKALREAFREHAEILGREAWQETGLGRAEDKRLKNLLVAEHTPGPEDLETATLRGGGGRTWTEYSPYGVIASITPTTNPTSTIINNSLAMLSAGNSVVFNVHPNARRVSLDTVRLISRVSAAVGAPPNLVTAICEPTIDSAKALMHHPKVRLLLVTGGPGVVKEALATQKKAITAGPGNPPVVVDETADLEVAAAGIVAGASFDNNVICTDEKEVLVVESVADELLRRLRRQPVHILAEHEVRKVERVIFRQLGAPGRPGRIEPKWIGQNAGKILEAAGLGAADDGLRLLIAPVPVDHSLVWTEQLLPVLPIARVADSRRALDVARRAEHGFGHTASIYSRNVETITAMARALSVSIFIVNGPNYSGLGYGAEGFTSFSIASPTGEGLTRPRTFSRVRRMTVLGSLEGF
ncbi:MAG: aldehyde dehydrogenase [Acidobacteriota bacterium]